MDTEYQLPTSKLQPLLDPAKTPLVFVACGSFSPVTYLHLRMFEMARDHARFHSDFQVVGGFMSLVNDAYKKPGLAPAVHRYEMCRLACEESSDWIMVDPWEARQAEYVRTATVLDHFDYHLNQVLGGVDCPATGEKRSVRIVLLAGSDLIQTMSQPGLWSEHDLHHILGQFGCYIIERAESEIDESQLSDSVHSQSPLAMYRNRIYLVPQLVRNDVSSTKVRLFIRKGMSVEYLVPGPVVKYIRQHGLYQDELAGPSCSTICTPFIQASRSPVLKAVPDTSLPASFNHQLSPSLQVPSLASVNQSLLKSLLNSKKKA
ncbi:hypothetical protein Pst134EA_009223 [Puccinia striiformis f. sp. tritici]|uniref:Nicotinamide-nucleotide adenylyltransferase n=1 Tax=Puccinia striiformis f. sp. tritici PST-78 TaxID=1165861 RepID=A0A0L0VCH8_9BASI|nr:hypothetical protein Pst134EA_009223 [Puccinia striiformis f. sp. tritici]KAH9468689.1 hypothetical protein Pst134EA_009223 [Puccinia striiformis f. sp. tritici]KNE96955.1 hypothetical protein PSTG_09690 [Puccinia striiformis f. sp. tritici PST-78]